MKRLAVGLASLVALLIAAACSDDPVGPGTLDLVVGGPVPLGAAVVELVGEGVEGIEQPTVGWAELVPMPPQGGVPVHRLVVIQEAPGVLGVRLRVRDVETTRPLTTVIEATDSTDAPLPSLAAVEVVLRR